MLEKLITNIKNSLPGAKKNADSEDSENVEETEEGTESSGDSSAEDEKKKKISMIIRVVVILGLGYTAVDHFFLSATPEPSIEELTAAAPKRKRPKFKKPDETAGQAANEAGAGAGAAAGTSATTMASPGDNPGSGSADASSPSPDTVVTETTPPVESINILDKTEAPPVDEPVAQADTETAETSSASTASKSTASPERKTEGESAVGEVARTDDPNLDQRLDQLIDNVEKKEETNETSMASKIEEEVAATPPPAYDVLGRGLVYNCKEKFWACIDKPGYVTCNKNMKYNKSKGNPMECVVQNVYNSDEDCAKVQRYNVSTSQPTTFCSN